MLFQEPEPEPEQEVKISRKRKAVPVVSTASTRPRRGAKTEDSEEVSEDLIAVPVKKSKSRSARTETVDVVEEAPPKRGRGRKASESEATPEVIKKGNKKVVESEAKTPTVAPKSRRATSKRDLAEAKVLPSTIDLSSESDEVPEVEPPKPKNRRLNKLQAAAETVEVSPKRGSRRVTTPVRETPKKSNPRAAKVVEPTPEPEKIPKGRRGAKKVDEEAEEAPTTSRRGKNVALEPESKNRTKSTAASPEVIQPTRKGRGKAKVSSEKESTIEDVEGILIIIFRLNKCYLFPLNFRIGRRSQTYSKTKSRARSFSGINTNSSR